MVLGIPAAHVFDVLYVDTRIFALFISDGVSGCLVFYCIVHYLFEIYII